MRSLHLGGISLLGGVAVAVTVLALGFARPAVAADMIGNCELTGQKGQFPLTPAVAGQLTVEVNLPAPGWWNGDTPDTIKDGYEYCMAANIAYRAGLDKVAVTNVAWDALVAGQTKAFDLALSEISITDERKKVVDFSVPYFSSDIGILANKGLKVDGPTMKGLRIGVQTATTGADFVTGKLKPQPEVKQFPDTPSMWAALAANQIDAAMTDTAIVLAQATASGGTQSSSDSTRPARPMARFTPKIQPTRRTFDKIIQSLIDDGTLKKLSAKYLAAAWGTDPSTVPYFQP